MNLFLEIINYFLFIQFPILVKALLIWLINGKEAAAEYRRRMFAQLMSEFAPIFNLKTKDIKTRLFEDLVHLKSKDPELRKVGKIRILEIGIGSAPNLQFYPKNCNLIALDSNSAYGNIVRDKLKRYPEMALEDFVVGSALNMATIPSESIDVVVATTVLCSVGSNDNIRQVCNEIHRVLAKGGRYYYMEHILEEPNTMLNIIQRIVTKFKIWPFFFDGCAYLSLDTLLKELGLFSTVEQKNVHIDTSGFWIFRMLHTLVSGVQIK